MKSGAAIGDRIGVDQRHARKDIEEAQCAAERHDDAQAPAAHGRFGRTDFRPPARQMMTATGAMAMALLNSMSWKAS